MYFWVENKIIKESFLEEQKTTNWPFLNYSLVPSPQKINNSAAGIQTPLTLKGQVGGADTCCTTKDVCSRFIVELASIFHTENNNQGIQ